MSLQTIFLSLSYKTFYSFLINQGRYKAFLILRVKFGLEWDKPKDYYIHRFVFEAIKGVIPDGFEINHTNAIKNDNRLSNLELVTHKTKY